MNVQRSDTLKTFTTPNAIITPLATPSLGAQQVSVIRQSMAAAHQNPTHSHSHEEVMVVLGGQVTLSLEGQEYDLRVEDTTSVPQHTLHSLTNSGKMAAEWLIISPAGVQVFDAGGKELVPDWLK